MPRYCELSKTRVLGKWGDYGDILCNGLGMGSRGETPLRLGRTGPFVPPITFVFPGHVIVTDEGVKKIEASGLHGIGDFRPVAIEKAVKSDWHTWDRNRKIRDDRYPFDNEPEEYILHPPHDPAIAAAIAPLFTWHPINTGEAVGPPEARRVEQVSATADVFRVHRLFRGGVFASERGRTVLAEIFGEWLDFEEPFLPIFTK